MIVRTEQGVYVKLHVLHIRYLGRGVFPGSPGHGICTKENSVIDFLSLQTIPVPLLYLHLKGLQT